MMARSRFPTLAAATSLAVAVVCASLAEMAHARQSPSARITTAYGSGPVAISVLEGGEAVVLQADGHAYSLNLGTGAIGRQVYRVPSGYQAVDIVSGLVKGSLITCFSLNPRSSKDGRSFVLQVTPDKREVWTWLRVAGVYVGLALEPVRGVVYAANATTNEVYAVTIGDQKIAPTRVAAIPRAVRLGAMAIATATRRLYVSDMGAARIYVIELANGAVRTIDASVEETRALAWDGRRHRLYIADSGHEAVFVVDPNARAPRVERVVSDKRLRDPAGLTVAPDGTLWVADEAGRSLFQVSAETKSITRTVRWAPPKAAM
jgi:DNA-binding beta-propeller fold protein YncE